MSATALDHSRPLLQEQPFTTTAFDPEAHGAFVYETFTSQTGKERRELRRVLQRNPVRLLVATPYDDATALMSWAAVLPGNRLVFAYTKFVFRRMGIASTMAIAMGLDFTKRVDCLFWTRCLNRIAAKPGNPYNLYPALRERRPK